MTPLTQRLEVVAKRMEAAINGSVVMLGRKHPREVMEAVVRIAELEADRQELIAALTAMVERYAKEDHWEVPIECDVNARAVLAKYWT